jgi:hypothetical protein
MKRNFGFCLCLVFSCFLLDSCDPSKEKSVAPGGRTPDVANNANEEKSADTLLNQTNTPETLPANDSTDASMSSPVVEDFVLHPGDRVKLKSLTAGEAILEVTTAEGKGPTETHVSLPFAYAYITGPDLDKNVVISASYIYISRRGRGYLKVIISASNNNQYMKIFRVDETKEVVVEPNYREFYTFMDVGS